MLSVPCKAFGKGLAIILRGLEDLFVCTLDRGFHGSLELFGHFLSALF